jgi:hypothetical protein
VVVDDGSPDCTVFCEWSPVRCPLAAGILSGLYHFPISSGDVVFVVEASCETLSHLSTLVGPTGQVRAICSGESSSALHRAQLLKCFTNVWLHASDSAFDPEADRKSVQVSLTELLRGTYSSRTVSPLTALRVCRKEFIESVSTFLGTFPETPAVTAALFLFPPGLPALSPDSVEVYGSYLCKTVPSVFSGAQSVWLALALRVQPALARFEEAVDYCCERIFDLLAVSSGPHGSVRPKEQLRIDPQFSPDTVLLVSRFKRGSRPPTPTLLSEVDLVQAFASLASQAERGQSQSSPAIPSLLSELLGQCEPARARPQPNLDPQLLFDLQQATSAKRLSLSDLVGGPERGH